VALNAARTAGAAALTAPARRAGVRLFFRQTLALVAASLAALAGGCTAMSTIKTATTVPRGVNQYIFALEGNGGAPMEFPVKPLLPELVAGLRRGLTERVEVGGKLTTLPLGRAVTTAGLEGEVKVQLRRRPDSRIELALGPAAGFRYVYSSGASMQVTYATVPLLCGINVGRHQIVVSPEAGLQLWTSAGSTPIWAPMGGLTLGFVWRLGQRFALVPEVSAYRTPVAIDYSRGSQMIHVGIGFLY
jgi:hypothetical protein